MRKLKDIIEDIQENEKWDLLPVIVVFIGLIIIVSVIIYTTINLNYETYYTTGIVTEKYEDEYDTHRVILNSNGRFQRLETIHHHDYWIVATVPDTEGTAKINQLSFYEHHKIGDSVKIKVVEKYWKSKYLDTSYLIQY